MFRYGCFQHEICESRLLALRIWSVLGLELGTLIIFVVSAACILGIKKAAESYPRTQKATTVVLAISIIMHAYPLISNLYVFMLAA
jgi:hypothetical protein